jgi:hypothetical protein
MSSPFTLAEIVSWYRSKQNELQSCGVSLVDIREFGEDSPGAVVDFDEANAIGRICGWVSGDFDFEVLRISDSKTLFGGHVRASSISDLEAKYEEFVRHLQNPDLTGSS